MGAELALSPSQRSAMIYALDLERRDQLVRAVVEAVGDLEGVDLVMWLREGTGAAAPMSEAVIRAAGGVRAALRPGGELSDLRGRALER